MSTKNEMLSKALKSIDDSANKLATETTFGQKALAGLSLTAKAVGMKVVTVGGNVVDTTYKLGKVAVKASLNAPEVLNAIADRADKQLDELSIEGQALGLDRAFGIGASVSDGYNKVKDKFSKKEGTAVIESASKANIQTQTAS